MRRILSYLLIALTVVAIGIVYFVGNVDRLLKSIIENTGTEVIGTSVSVGAVELSLSERSAVIRDLRISNPKGFSSEPALHIDEISAQLDADDYQIIRKVYAGGVDVRVESKGLDTNYKQLQENVSNYTSRTEKEPQAEPDGEPITLTIDLVELEKAEAVLVSDVLAEPLGFRLDRIQIRKLSGTPRQITEQLLAQITARVVSAAALKVLEAQGRDKGVDVNAAVTEILEQLIEGDEETTSDDADPE